MAYINGQRVLSVVHTIAATTTEVEANPAGDASTNLTKLKVQDTIFNLEDTTSREEIENIKESLYGYIFDTTNIDVVGTIPTSVSVSGTTYLVADNTRALLSEVRGNTTFTQGFSGLKSSIVSGVEFTGKNLCDNSNLNIGFYEADGSFVSNANFITSDLIYVEVGKTYTASLFDNNKTRVANLVYSLFNSDGNFIENITYLQTITIPSGDKYLSIRNFSTQSSYITSNNYLYQLEEGSTSTAYKSYYKTDLPFPQTFTLNGVGTSQDLVQISKNSDDAYYTMKQIVNCGQRAYQSSDDTDTSVITDGTNTIYALATSTETIISSTLTKDDVTALIKSGYNVAVVGNDNSDYVSPDVNLTLVYKKVGA